MTAALVGRTPTTHEALIRQGISRRLGTPILLLMKDNTIVSGTANSLTGEYVHIGWLKIPVHAIESITGKRLR